MWELSELDTGLCSLRGKLSYNEGTLRATLILIIIQLSTVCSGRPLINEPRSLTDQIFGFPLISTHYCARGDINQVSTAYHSV